MQSEGATLAWLDLLDLFSFAKPQTLVDSIALVAFLSVLIICLSRGKVWDRPGPLHHLWFERPQLKHGVVWAAEKQTRNVAQRMEELVNLLHDPSLHGLRLIMPLRIGNWSSSGVHNPGLRKLSQIDWPGMPSYDLD